MEEIKVWQQGFVKNSKIIPYNKSIYNAVIVSYEGKQVEFQIKDVKKKPSQETHGYYRGVILPVCTQSEQFRGWELDEIHKYFASKYLKDVIEKDINGTKVLIVTTMSTGEASQKRMNRFIEEVRNELTAMGINTPEPTRYEKKHNKGQ